MANPEGQLVRSPREEPLPLGELVEPWAGVVGVEVVDKDGDQQACLGEAPLGQLAEQFAHRVALAVEAGVDLTDAEAVGPFHLGSTEVTGLAKTVGCVIEDGTGAAISLEDVRVTFLSSWPYPGFGAILGTIAMKQLLVTVSAGQGWIEILEAGSGGGPGNARRTQLSQVPPVRPMT